MDLRRMAKAIRTGAALGQAREVAGLTRSQLAARVGLHRNSIKYWERPDKRVTSRDQAPMRIALALGLTLPQRRSRFVPTAPRLSSDPEDRDKYDSNTRAGAQASWGDSRRPLKNPRVWTCPERPQRAR